MSDYSIRCPHPWRARKHTYGKWSVGSDGVSLRRRDTESCTACGAVRYVDSYYLRTVYHPWMLPIRREDGGT